MPRYKAPRSTQSALAHLTENQATRQAEFPTATCITGLQTQHWARCGDVLLSSQHLRGREDQEFKVILDYTAKLDASLGYMELSQKRETMAKHKTIIKK